MTQRAEAGAIADAYLTLDDTGRERFFRLLARDFWIDPAAVREASEVLRAAATPLERRAAEHDLRDALTPPAGRLLRLFTGLDGGVKLLVDLRADLLRYVGDDQELAPGRRAALPAPRHACSTSGCSRCSASRGTRRRRCSRS